MSNKTLDYYNKNAVTFAEETVTADISDIRKRFESRINTPSPLLLDWGCGSGRDSLGFIKDGEFEGEEKERHFTYLTEDDFGDVMKEVECMKLIDMWISTDVRRGVDVEVKEWLETQDFDAVIPEYTYGDSRIDFSG